MPAGDYVAIRAWNERRISVSRLTAPFPNGAVMHIIAWHDVNAEGTIRGRSASLATMDTELGGDRGGGRGGDSPSGARLRPRGDDAAYGGLGAADEEAEREHERARAEHDRSEKSGATSATVSMLRKSVLAGQVGVPPALRRLRRFAIIVVAIVIIASAVLSVAASKNLAAVLAATQLVWSGAARCAHTYPARVSRTCFVAGVRACCYLG